MTRSPVIRPLGLGLVLGLVLGGCTDNTAPGNDREAELDPPAAPAQVTSVGAALDGIATASVIPETMTEADQGNVPAAAKRCAFRMTRVGFPVFFYGSTGVAKLNGKLVPLPAGGEGRYAANGVEVTVRPLEGASEDGSPFPAELVLRLPDAPDELGYHGFAECRGGG